MSKTGWSQIAKDFAKPAMTDEEAAKTQSIIDHISSLAPGCYPAISDKDDAKIIVSALRAQQERENPKPLTLDELREMDGEPAYFQFGDGVQGWAIIEWQTESGIILYGPVADDHSEPDVDFINMKYDDPDGYFGLHLLGWIAYRIRPKEAQS